MPFENILNITVKAFFFNAKTDYLPYYKSFSFSVQNDATVLDLLAMIKEKNSNFSYPDANIILKINNLIMDTKEKLSDVVERLGTELQIDPALAYRSDNGLILNNNDFMQSFELLAPYASETDKSYYQSLYKEHYASETTHYNKTYIGDAILILASKMIDNGSKDKKAILNAINDEFNGLKACEYENNLFNGKDYTETIEALKLMLEIPNKNTFCESLTALTAKKQKSQLEDIEGHNIALYLGKSNNFELTNEIRNEIKEASANFIKFDMSTKLAGQTLMKSHAQLAYLKAGTMLLDALDSGADILLFAQEDDLKVFKKTITLAEKELGRDIELTLLSVEEFRVLANKVEV